MLGLDEIEEGEGAGRQAGDGEGRGGEEEEGKRGELEGREQAERSMGCHMSGPGEHRVRLTQALGPGPPSLRGGGIAGIPAIGTHVSVLSQG